MEVEKNVTTAEKNKQITTIDWNSYTFNADTAKGRPKEAILKRFRREVETIFPNCSDLAELVQKRDEIEEGLQKKCRSAGRFQGKKYLKKDIVAIIGTIFLDEKNLKSKTTENGEEGNKIFDLTKTEEHARIKDFFTSEDSCVALTKDGKIDMSAMPRGHLYAYKTA